MAKDKEIELENVVEIEKMSPAKWQKKLNRHVDKVNHFVATFQQNWTDETLINVDEYETALQLAANTIVG